MQHLLSTCVLGDGICRGTSQRLQERLQEEVQPLCISGLKTDTFIFGNYMIVLILHCVNVSLHSVFCLLIASKFSHFDGSLVTCTCVNLSIIKLSNIM